MTYLDEKRLKASHDEYESWQRLFAQLVRLNAVTRADGESPTDSRGTPGLELIHLIKQWAYRYADLIAVIPEVRKNEPNLPEVL